MSNTNKPLSQQIKNAIAIRAARENFSSYCPVIDSKYQLEWFHEQIANKLQDAIERVEKGEDVRSMIFMPPRHGKSDTATQKFPSWVLGKHPDWPFIVASYSQELATDFGQGTRDLMDSGNYKAIFNTRLRADTQAKAKWMTEGKGGYTAVGVGGAITGRGFKVGIVDDPFKNREEADSPVTRESVHKWWRSTFYTRQEGNTAIIMILTRWHDDDLAGRVLKEQAEAEKFGDENIDKWEVIQFKAIAEEEEPFRKKGDALWPSKFSVAKLERTKQSLGGYEWSSLYQQNPIDEANQEFKREWLQYKTWDEVDSMNTRKFATIDSALSKNAKSDFTGVTRNYVNDLNEWHFKTQRYKISSKQLIDLIFTLHEEGMETIGIEEGAYFSAVEPFLKEEMEERGVYPNVVVLKHGGIMKETRIRGLIPRYENKKVFHIENTCVDLEEEYLRFPKCAHDDCLDAAAYQNQVAAPPASGIGDRLLISEIEQNISKTINEQSGNIIIGISTATPVHYLIGNSEGIFFNRVCGDGVDPYVEIESLIKRWEKVMIVADQVGDAIGIKTLQSKYPGKVYIAWLKSDVKSQDTVRWDYDSNEVVISRNAMVQQIIDEMRDKRVTFNGDAEDWSQFTAQWLNMYRTWTVDNLGEQVHNWESSGPQHFIKAMLYFRVGLDQYAKSAAQIVDADPIGDLPIARIFNDGFTL